MNYTEKMKKVLEDLHGENLTLAEKQKISDAVDTLVNGLKDELTLDGWIDVNGEISVR